MKLHYTGQDCFAARFSINQERCNEIRQSNPLHQKVHAILGAVTASSAGRDDTVYDPADQPDPPGNEDEEEEPDDSHYHPPAVTLAVAAVTSALPLTLALRHTAAGPSTVLLSKNSTFQVQLMVLRTMALLG